MLQLSPAQQKNYLTNLASCSVWMVHLLYTYKLRPKNFSPPWVHIHPVTPGYAYVLYIGLIINK